MNSILTSGFIKTALALSVLTGGQALAQSSNNTLRSAQNFSSVFTNHSNSVSKVSALVSRPGNSQDFIASGPGTGTWQHMTNSTYTYDNQGRLTQRLYTDPSTGLNRGRTLSTYDSHGEEIEYKSEQWQGTNWVTMYAHRSVITYNSLGKKLETIFQSWDSFMNTWENDYREQITYDTNNLVATITNSSWDMNTWNFEDRMVLSNVGGTSTSAIVQEYVAGAGIWEDIYRAQNLTWYVPYEIPSNYVLQYNDNGTWINEEKYTAVYDTNGGHVGVYEEWNDINNVWEKSSRETESFDNNKNFTGWKDEGWNSGSNTWDLDGEEREVLTYAGIDVTERIFQDSWGSTTGTLQDREKEIYSNFQTFNVSGIKNTLPELAVNVYPNPATEKLTISFPENNAGFTATLTDVTGKTCLTKTFKNGEANQLNIEALPKGIYMLQLQTEAGSIVKRIVKQ